MMELLSDELTGDDFKIIGVPRKLHKTTLDSMKLGKPEMVQVERVLADRCNLLIRGGEVGFAVLRAMLDTKYCLNGNGTINPRKVRYIRADDFVLRLNDAGFKRQAIWDNLFVAEDDGSGWVRSIMIAGLGDEYGKDASNHMKYIINRCDADMVQLIVETMFDDVFLTNRYGARCFGLLNSGEVLKL